MNSARTLLSMMAEFDSAHSDSTKSGESGAGESEQLRDPVAGLGAEGRHCRDCAETGAFSDGGLEP